MLKYSRLKCFQDKNIGPPPPRIKTPGTSLVHSIRSLDAFSPLFSLCTVAFVVMSSDKCRSVAHVPATPTELRSEFRDWDVAGSDLRALTAPWSRFCPPSICFPFSRGQFALRVKPSPFHDQEQEQFVRTTASRRTARRSRPSLRRTRRRQSAAIVVRRTTKID